MVAVPATPLRAMNATVVGLVTPHLMAVIDLAGQAESGINVDWHVRAAVAKTADELSGQFNAADLLAAYVHGLQAAVRDARSRGPYAGALQAAVVLAERELRRRG